MPRQLAAGATHTVEVVAVTDGDTLDVRFPDGTKEELRIIGVDAPETKRNQQFERPQEWEGIDDPQELVRWGEQAKQFAREQLAGTTVTVAFDPGEPVRDAFDRLLVYLEYDRDGAAVLYNRVLLAEGYGRVYDSGLTNHDAFRAVEQTARTADAGLWAESDPAATAPVRNRAVDTLFVPRSSSVRTADGPLPPGRAPVRAEATAAQELRSGDAIRYADDPIPLVGVDADARVAVVGGLVINERYEQAEGFAVDTADYEQFVFLTNLLTWLADREGPVFIDGGHGQFGVDYALSSEDAAYFQRYLEGQGIAFEQHNGLAAGVLDGARGLVVTTPVGAFGTGETERLRQFRDAGGAVILASTAAAPAFARSHTNRLAAALGTDLRLSTDRVRDEQHNLIDDPTLPTTTRFARSLPLFAAYADGLRDVFLALAEVTADPGGGESLAAETVTLANRGGTALDLSGWVLRDRADHRFTFPEGVDLAAGATVTIHTGDGENSATDLYWGASRPIWNNQGDTVIIEDATGHEVFRASY